MTQAQQNLKKFQFRFVLILSRRKLKRLKDLLEENFLDKELQSHKQDM